MGKVSMLIGRSLKSLLRAIAFVAVACPFAAAGAQGSLRGRVLRDATRAPIVGAEVVLPESDRRALTDSAGAFAFEDVGEGWLIVQIRKVGYAARRDTINVRGNTSLAREFLLTSQAQLDTVKTISAQERYLSPALRAFEERRKNSTAGFFIPEDVLRKADEKSLASVIVQHAAGLQAITQGKATGTTLASTRKECSGPVFAQGSKGDRCQTCYVTVYADGQLIYEANPRNPTPPPDFAQMQVSDYAAVEFYPGSGTAPVQFGRTSSGCGVLLLWSRER